MSLKELREKLGAAAKQKDALAKSVETWTNTERKAHADAKAEVELLRGQIAVMEESEAEMRDLAKPVRRRKPYIHGASDQRSDGQGPRFRLANGTEVRALLPSEPMAPRDQNEEPIDLGNCLRSIVLGDDSALNDAERRTMMGTNDVQGGHLLVPELSAMMIDLARANSVCMRAGAITIPCSTSEMTIVRQIADPVAYWRGEGETFPNDDVRFDAVFLRPRTLAAAVPITIEMLEDAPNCGQILTNSFQRAMAVAIDSAALTGAGQGLAAPVGLTNTEGINVQTGCGTPTADDSAWVKLIDAVGQIQSANFTGDISELAWVANPRERTSFAKLLDGTYQPLQMPSMVAELQKFTTTSLPITEGAGAESSAIVGHFPSLAFGFRNSGVTVRVLDGGMTEVQQLKRIFVAHIRVDVAVLRPSFFTKLTGWTVG